LTKRSHQRPCGAAPQKKRIQAHPPTAGRSGCLARTRLPARQRHARL